MWTKKAKNEASGSRIINNEGGHSGFGRRTNITCQLFSPVSRGGKLYRGGRQTTSTCANIQDVDACNFNAAFGEVVVSVLGELEKGQNYSGRRTEGSESGAIQDGMKQIFDKSAPLEQSV